MKLKNLTKKLTTLAITALMATTLVSTQNVLAASKKAQKKANKAYAQAIKKNKVAKFTSYSLIEVTGGGTKEQYVALAKKIQERIPGVSFTTDIIVGFPGETEEDFKETLDVVREVGFDSAYTYVYSKRSGTPAASMEDQVDKDVIKDRFDRLLALLKETSAKNCKKKVGDIERVLIEEENTHEEGMLTGRLENNLLVHFKGCKEQIGTMADVKLVEEKGFYYMGEQIHG